MADYLNTILRGQFEAALCMFNQCVQACPPQHWEGKIANGTFRWVAYHTLFWVDLYLSPGDEDAFELRDLHKSGGDEREPLPGAGLEKDETLGYLTICRQRMLEVLSRETRKQLEGPSGFAWKKFSRGELHLYNLRHVQHHTGQLSAFLRKVAPERIEHNDLPWIGTGWR